jgi:hypothetical protein
MTPGGEVEDAETKTKYKNNESIQILTVLRTERGSTIPLTSTIVYGVGRWRKIIKRGA